VIANKKELIIGLMSGTSVDGIDAALVEFDSVNSLNVIETEFTPYSDNLKLKINKLALSNKRLNKSDYLELDNELAESYANASLSLLKKASHTEKQVSAIANHGQTIRHEPNADEPYSLQLGNGQLIADRTGIKTISNFRQKDISLGGQGAPLMPAFHQSIFKQGDENVIILNIGGIANITDLRDEVVGFDTGPGNTLIDQWIKKSMGLAFDKNGNWAKSGTVQKDLLSLCLQDSYFKQPFPKSTGPDFFNLKWFENTIGDLQNYAPKDLQATLLEMTVESIALAIDDIKMQEGDIYICGGGAHNTEMLNRLQLRLKQFNISTTDELGIPADWVESVGFAWLGYCYLHNIPSNLPNVTGASEYAVLGESHSPKVT